MYTVLYVNDISAILGKILSSPSTSSSLLPPLLPLACRHHQLLSPSLPPLLALHKHYPLCHTTKIAVEAVSTVTPLTWPLRLLWLPRFKKWLHPVFVVARGIFDCCGMRNLVPQPGINVDPLALGAQNLSRWTTTEVPLIVFNYILIAVYQPMFWMHHNVWTLFYWGWTLQLLIVSCVINNAVINILARVLLEDTGVHFCWRFTQEWSCVGGVG